MTKLTGPGTSRSGPVRRARPLGRGDVPIVSRDSSINELGPAFRSYGYGHGSESSVRLSFSARTASCVRHVPQPSWKPISSCFWRSAPDLWHTSARSGSPVHCLHRYVGSHGAFGVGPEIGPAASVETSRFCGLGQEHAPGVSSISVPSGEAITTEKIPPAWGLIATRATVQGLGANHCLRSSGSVQARQSWAGVAASLARRTVTAHSGRSTHSAARR